MKDWPRIAAWWAVLFGVGLLCVASLFDRLAGQGLLVAPSALFPDGGNASTARAEAALRRGDVAAANRYAVAALKRRPVEAAALRVAGMAALAKGDAAAAETLMRLAGASGWRDVPTQVYWGEAAIEQGAFDVAAQRLDAITRLGQTRASRQLLGELEATAGGRAALARRWDGQTDRLTPWLAAWPTDPAAVAGRLALVGMLRDRLGPSGLNQIVQPLVASGRYEEAFAILKPDQTRLGFLAEGAAGPLDWLMTSDAAIQQVEVGPGRALHIIASSPSLVPFAARVLRLAPGRIRMSLVVRGAKTDLPVIATLACLKGEGASAVAARNSI